MGKQKAAVNAATEAEEKESSDVNTKTPEHELPMMETVDVTNVATIPIPPEMPIVIDEHAVEDILGPPMFESEVSERLSTPGVAIGLAWTMVGGEIMYVEATQIE